MSAPVVNALGLHARAAARFVAIASRFRSQIRVTRGGRTTDGKSILGLLLLAAARGAVLVISADGPDEQDAVDALNAFTAKVSRTHDQTTGRGVSRAWRWAARWSPCAGRRSLPAGASGVDRGSSACARPASTRARPRGDFVARLPAMGSAQAAISRRSYSCSTTRCFRAAPMS